MGLIASLDIGSEKMVMALAATENNTCRLTGIKFVASLGVELGKVVDKTKMQACIRTLFTELVKDRLVDSLNIGLSGSVVQICERKINLPLQRKIVEQIDLERAEQRCADSFEQGPEELVDIIPVAYSVDRGELVANPLGRQGRNLEVTFEVYRSTTAYLSELRSMFDEYDVREINFFPVSRVYSEAMDAMGSEVDFALVDLGASMINVALFRDGLLEYEAVLPLGTRSIDRDIMSAFGINAQQARKMKHEYGQALRSSCKNKKLVIPDSKLSIESRDLTTVIQSRSEELMEGVTCLLQRWGFEAEDGDILLTGGGSRLMDLDVLLHKMAGHQVARAKVKQLQTPKEEVLRTPEYFTALGLLLCDRQEPQAQKGGLLDKLKGLFS